MQINIADAWPKSTEAVHSEYIAQLIGKMLPARTRLMNTLVQQFGAKLALASPRELREIITEMKSLEAQWPQEVNDFHADCERLFDYDRFAAKGSQQWNAYALCKTSKYRLCPYCQQSMAITIHRTADGKSFRPTLDHFYPKSKYPYVALSLYNLVPSCYTCNSSLKGSIDFYSRPHLNPFEDDELIRYRWDIQAYIKRRETGESNPPTEITIRADFKPGRKYRLGRSMRTFLIRERLAFNEPEIARFVEVLLDYSRGRMDDVNATIGRHHWHISEASALQFSHAEYKNEWLGRLKRDLYEASPLQTSPPPLTASAPDPAA